MQYIYDEDYFADTELTAHFSEEGFSMSVEDTLGFILGPMEYADLLYKYAYSTIKGLHTHVIFAVKNLSLENPEKRRPVFIGCKILRPRRLIDLETLELIDRRDTRYKYLATFKDFEGFKIFCEALMKEIWLWYERTS